MSSAVQIVMGGASIQSTWGFQTAEQILPLFDCLCAASVSKIDTAQVYGDSESLLGSVVAGKTFTLDTKAPGGFVKGSLKTETLVAGLKESLQRLKVEKVDIFYIHAPDKSVPLSAWLPGINETYNSGLFSRFGLSNFKVEDVVEIYNYCEVHSYVLPTVYQGNYNAIARLAESLLLPTLRKLGISFYAYSPTAGGFLSKSKQDFTLESIKGRFDTTTGVGKEYTQMYCRPTLLAALGEWEELATEANCEKVEVAFRWLVWNSDLKNHLGDAIIIGASSIKQVEQTFAWIRKGPISEDTCKAINNMWSKVKDEAPLDNYHK